MKRFEGKLFGAALGFSFGGPIGAIIGAVIGHFVDTSMDRRNMGHRGSIGSKELTFVTSLVLLLVGTAKADGRITDDEKETIVNFFSQQLGYRGGDLDFIRRMIDEAIYRDINIRDVCESIKLHTVYEERLFLVQLNYRVAISDGVLSDSEDRFINRTAEYLGINPYDFATIRNSFQSYRRAYSTGGSSGGGRNAPVFRTPYEVLGLSENCSDEEVHRAFRNLANKYHPDKVAHLGKEFIELANEKFTEIQKAYEAIKKQRGIK